MRARISLSALLALCVSGGSRVLTAKGCGVSLSQAEVNSKVICGSKFNILMAGLHWYC